MSQNRGQTTFVHLAISMSAGAISRTVAAFFVPAVKKSRENVREGYQKVVKIIGVRPCFEEISGLTPVLGGGNKWSDPGFGG
jgi:hypothetical protein